MFTSVLQGVGRFVSRHLFTVKIRKARNVSRHRNAPPIDPVFLRIGLGLLFLGVLLVGSGTWLGISCSSTEGFGVEEGVVVDLRWHSSGRQAAPITEFQFNEQNYRLVSKVYSSLSPSIGQKVKVVFPPHDPDKGRIYSFSNNWMLPLIICFVGSIALFLGVVGIFQALGGKRRFKLRVIR